MNDQLDDARTRLKAGAEPQPPEPQPETPVSPRSYKVFRKAAILDLVDDSDSALEVYVLIDTTEARNGDAAMRALSTDLPEGTTLAACASGRWTEKTTKVKVETSVELV